MSMPNFFLIGASKAGTTAVFNYLKEHPQVYMSPDKEPNYFALAGQEVAFTGPGDKHRINQWSVNTLEDYQKLFDGVTDEIAIGESSQYMHDDKASARIKEAVPDAKLIAIIRQPAERAFSGYSMRIREGAEPLSFEDALKAEQSRIKKGWSWGQYATAGMYYKQLKPIYDLFGAENIKTFLYDELRADNLGVMVQVYNFLGIDADFIPNTNRRHNESIIPSNPLVYKLISKPNIISAIYRTILPHAIVRRFEKWLIGNNVKRLKLEPEMKRRMTDEYFREDIVALQDLIGKDLTHWLEF